MDSWKVQSQSAAGGDGDAAAHDGVGAQIALGEIGDVHGAAAALAVAGGLAHQFCQCAIQFGALGNAVAMTPVGGCNQILIRQLGTDRGGHGLLAGVQVNRAPQFVLREQCPRRLLEVPDLVHLVIDPKTGFLVDHNERHLHI